MVTTGALMVSTAAATSTTARIARAGTCHRTIRSAAAGVSSADDSRASPLARNSPMGAAIVKPRLLPGSSTPGVASACRPRKPDTAMNASDTRKSRASDRVRACSLMRTDKPRLIAATPATSHRWTR
jgi:hypothetical protein